MSKTAAFDMAVPVVKSTKLPAVQKRQLRDFDDFARQGQTFLHLFDGWQKDYDAISEAETVTPFLLQWAEARAADTRRPHLEQEMKRFDAEWAWFEREELYEKARSAPDLLNTYSEWVLTRRFVGEQLGLAVAMINQKAQSPKLYSRMMVEEVIAARPSACALESTCREIRRSKDYLPTGRELLEILRRQMTHWGELCELGADTLGYWQSTFDALVASMKSELAATAAKLAGRGTMVADASVLKPAWSHWVVHMPLAGAGAVSADATIVHREAKRKRGQS